MRSQTFCCLNPNCQKPVNPGGAKFCQNCGKPLVCLRGRYLPRRPLGTGGFGKTYLAEDLDKLGELCAIKQLVPKVREIWAVEKARELFEREAQQLQKLGDRPDIPALMAYFEENNYLYLVQQYIEGRTLLDELNEKGSFNEAEIQKLCLDLLEILQFIHQERVIHRDIKPENIIRRQSDGKAILIDFGISKVLTETATQPGTTIGSLGYVPIEQMQQGQVYPASDLYSLGVTCFQLLCGVNPWELWKNEGYSWVTRWREHLPQPVSEPLGKVLDKILQQDYRNRYQSAEDVIRALAKRRQFPRSILVAIALLFLGLSSGAYLWYWVKNSREPNISVTIAPSEIFPSSDDDDANLNVRVGDIVRLSRAIALQENPNSQTQIGTVPGGSFLKVVGLESNSGWLSVEVCPILKGNSVSPSISQGWIKWETLQETGLEKRSSDLKNCPVVDFSP
jgi:serine/threonine protein kinase